MDVNLTVTEMASSFTATSTNDPSSTSFVPKVGLCFPTRDVLVDTVTQWIFLTGLSKKVARNDRTRYHIVCRKATELDCPFHLAAHPSTTTGQWVIKTYVPHRCPSTAHDGYKLARSAKMLARHHKSLLIAQPNITAKELQEQEMARGITLPYKQAWRALNRSRKSMLVESQRESEQTGQSPELDGAGDGDCDTQMDLSTTAGPLDPRLAATNVERPEDTRTQLQTATMHQSQPALPSASPQVQSSSSLVPSRYSLTFFVPPTHVKACKDAVFSAGAGRIGNYTNCSFQSTGIGQFMPIDGAHPSTGAVGQLEIGEEYRVEVICTDEDVAREAVRKLKEAHPYEEAVYWVKKMEDF
jgi:hypothetical protein